ncbi:nucleotide-binding universal stress UspA family protein [Breoghania corrubedonensis]|uniref:Nucleotide-binding universal stress UspA family protein n=1 Tax=Breoghania corrubedonensis TaxID=665038 RepID=A0A2T5VA82_9HYPH|nr:universal stress protein [Breoghania corrubedonensis]PTW60656.1 nucleotide-binding universal stress UspA family protein [Breoghania corrubedonensis]
MADGIIVLVDGSIYSRSVCEHAAWAAARTGAPVTLLHVLGRREAPEGIDLSGNLVLGARTALLKELSELDEKRAKLARQRGRAILEDAKAIVQAAGAENVTTLLRHGDIVETVNEMEGAASMVAVGKRGEAADFAKPHLGSNLERIARSVHRPLLVAARAFKPIESVLIAYDGGASAMKAVDHVARDPLFQGLRISLLMVGTETAETRRKIEDARAMLKAGGLTADAEIRPGQPETVIAEKGEREGFDLLVMGAYGHSRIRTLIIGSTTTEMMRSCKVPVLLFR